MPMVTQNIFIEMFASPANMLALNACITIYFTNSNKLKEGNFKNITYILHTTITHIFLRIKSSQINFLPDHWCSSSGRLVITHWTVVKEVMHSNPGKPDNGPRFDRQTSSTI